jgi:CheY-like chemotaxis protein
MPKGPGRSAVAATLRRLDLEVAVAADPYDAAAQVAERPADVLVASFEGWRRRDLRFLETARRRAPNAFVVALVPAERRALAAPATAAGADAWLPEPVDLRELSALVARARDTARRVRAEAGADPARLAAEIAHAVRNPLQVASLVLETAGPESRGLASDVRREIERVRRAVDLVAAYGGLSAPAARPVDLSPLLDERLSALEKEGVLVREGVPASSAPAGGPVLASADPNQVGLALDATLRFLAARAGDAPAPAQGVVRRVREEGTDLAEAAVRVRGARVAASEVEEAVGTVLWTDDRTRATHPGLAIPDAVARAHGGGLLARDTAAGTAVALRFPSA